MNEPVFRKMGRGFFKVVYCTRLSKCYWLCQISLPIKGSTDEKKVVWAKGRRFADATIGTRFVSFCIFLGKAFLWVHKVCTLASSRRRKTCVDDSPRASADTKLLGSSADGSGGCLARTRLYEVVLEDQYTSPL